MTTVLKIDADDRMHDIRHMALNIQRNHVRGVIASALGIGADDPSGRGGILSQYGRKTNGGESAFGVGGRRQEEEIIDEREIGARHHGHPQHAHVTHHHEDSEAGKWLKKIAELLEHVISMNPVAELESLIQLCSYGVQSGTSANNAPVSASTLSLALLGTAQRHILPERLCIAVNPSWNVTDAGDPPQNPIAVTDIKVARDSEFAGGQTSGNGQGGPLPAAVAVGGPGAAPGNMFAPTSFGARMRMHEMKIGTDIEIDISYSVPALPAQGSTGTGGAVYLDVIAGSVVGPSKPEILHR